MEWVCNQNTAGGSWNAHVLLGRVGVDDIGQGMAPTFTNNPQQLTLKNELKFMIRNKRGIWISRNSNLLQTEVKQRQLPMPHTHQHLFPRVQLTRARRSSHQAQAREDLPHQLPLQVLANRNLL